MKVSASHCEKSDLFELTQCWTKLLLTTEPFSGIEGPKEMSGMPAKYVCPVVFEKGDFFFTMICVLCHVTAPHNFKFFAELNGGITH